MFLDDQSSYRLNDYSPFLLVLSCFTMAFAIQLNSTFNLVNGLHSPLSFSLPIVLPLVH